MVATRPLSQSLASLRRALVEERGRLADLLERLDESLESLGRDTMKPKPPLLPSLVPRAPGAPTVLEEIEDAREEIEDTREDACGHALSACTVPDLPGTPESRRVSNEQTMELPRGDGKAGLRGAATPTVAWDLARGAQSVFHLESLAALEEPRPPLPGQVAENRSQLGGDRANEVAKLEAEGPVDASALRKSVRNSVWGPSVRNSVMKRRSIGIFADADVMKEQVQRAILQPEYDVRDLYSEQGVFQAVARSHAFECATLLAILLNALWLAVETDGNDEPILVYADWGFIVVENCFCAFFAAELVIRFMAFRIKRDTLRDCWFVFDTVLVVAMVLETWVLSIVVWISAGATTAGLGSSSALRVVRLFRLTRAARVARLLRALPELMVITRGIMIVTRTVFVIIGLLLIIVYVFSIVLTQLAKGTGLEATICKDVPTTMGTLLLGGILPDMKPTTDAMAAEHMAFAVFFFLFVLLAFVTIMNMLIGILVEVVSVVASVEKETNQVAAVKRVLLKWAPLADVDKDDLYGKEEFYAMLQDQGCAKDLNDVGVDAIALIDYTDFLFQNKESLTFSELLSVVLGLRGRNSTKVSDLVQLRKFLCMDLRRLEMSLQQLLRAVGGAGPQPSPSQPPSQGLASREQSSPVASPLLIPY